MKHLFLIRAGQITLLFLSLSFLTSCTEKESSEVSFLLLKNAKSCVINELEEKKTYSQENEFDYLIKDLYPTNEVYNPFYNGDFEQIITISKTSREGPKKALEQLQIIVNTIWVNCYPFKASSSVNINKNILFQHIADIDSNKPIYLRVQKGIVYKWEY